jgi:D-alanine-D-alanine ligase
MDKALFKTFLRDADIPTPESVTVEAGPWARDPETARRAVARQLGYPVFVKPARLGSSVGISRVDGPEALDAAIDLALAHDPKALVERCVAGREVEIGVLGNGDDLLVSPPGEITYESGWYDYETKYLPDRMRLVVPADLPQEVARRIEELARRAFVAIGCCGMARVDYFVEDGNALVSELNTIPGFTPTSVYAKLFEAGGVSYSELVGRLIELGLEAAAERGRYRA